MKGSIIFLQKLMKEKDSITKKDDPSPKFHWRSFQQGDFSGTGDK
jgi:hypothetical protein